MFSVELLGIVSAEVPEDDSADLHEVPGVPHPAERGPGCQGRTAALTSNVKPSIMDGLIKQ